MVKRLLAGVLKGLIIGVVVAGLILKGLGWTLIDGFMGYVLALGTGLVTGLVAGKPIWARDAKVEAGLKAVVGAALGAVVLFALRRWVTFDLDLGLIGAGQGAAADLTAFSLPAIATALALLFELDNTPESPSATSETTGKSKARIADASASNELAELEDESTEQPAPRARR
jgi:hypothetical protein